MSTGVPVILFCPVDCSPVDSDSGATKHLCHVCGQEWEMEVDLDRLSAHSPA